MLKPCRIGVVAPGCTVSSGTAKRIGAIATALPFPVEVVFHPQCFLSDGHFAGPDSARTAAFLEIANDPTFDALWWGRGGYGACRIVEPVMAGLSEVAARKAYLGYSDAGTMLAALYARGFKRVAHGPVAQDVLRDGGGAAASRALTYLATGARETLESTVLSGQPCAALNLTILSALIGTPWQPDLTGHVLMLEEVSEPMYRIDRELFHVTSNPAIRRVAGLKLGRCSLIPLNDPDFGVGEAEVAQLWCERSGIPWLGRADIGHDVANKIVPFGASRPTPGAVSGDDECIRDLSPEPLVRS